jgi:hypothetical protein
MREVTQPSALFLSERPMKASGSVVGASSEGARSLLVEVQALVGPPGLGTPRRTTTVVHGPPKHATGRPTERAPRCAIAEHAPAGLDAAKHRQLLATAALKEAYEPCEDDYTVTYLNDPAVQSALHVGKQGIKWGECSYTTRYNMSDSDVSMVPIYQYLINGGFNLNLLVYSGDDDSVCATIGTQSWIWGMGYEVQTLWQPYLVEGQTAGFLSQFAKTKLAFLTVHNAGHEVPTYTPGVALDMFTRYLKGEFTSF